MLKTTRARILAVCATVVVFSLAVNTALNYSIANKANDASIEDTLNALTSSQSLAINDWVTSKMQMVASLNDWVLTHDDPIPMFKQMAAAGKFLNLFIGYPDGTSKFADRNGIAADYNPTVRPWYQQAVA